MPPHVTFEQAKALDEVAGQRPGRARRAPLEVSARWSKSSSTQRRTDRDHDGQTHGEALGSSTHFIDRVVANVEHGRFERSLSGLTAVAAAVTTAEIYFEHYRASFGNKWMWSPIIVTPPVIVAGVDGGVQPRAGPRLPCRSRPWSTPPTACWASTSTPGGWPANRAGGGWLLQRADGPADRRPRADDPGRWHGPSGRAAAPGGLRWRRDLSKPDHLPNLRPAASRRIRRGCPGSAGATPRR